MNAIDKARLFLACLVIVEQESHEAPQDAGPVQVGIVGGENEKGVFGDKEWFESIDPIPY